MLKIVSTQEMERFVQLFNNELFGIPSFNLLPGEKFLNNNGIPAPFSNSSSLTKPITYKLLPFLRSSNSVSRKLSQID